MEQEESRQSKRGTVDTFAPSWRPAVSTGTTASGGTTRWMTNRTPTRISIFPSHRESPERLACASARVNQRWSGEAERQNKKHKDRRSERCGFGVLTERARTARRVIPVAFGSGRMRVVSAFECLSDLALASTRSHARTKLFEEPLETGRSHEDERRGIRAWFEGVPFATVHEDE